VVDDGRWTRLLDEHHANTARLQLGEPDALSWWGLIVGFLIPWVPFAIAWASPAASSSVGSWACVTIPLAIVIAWFHRPWRVAAFGLVVGTCGVVALGPTLLLVSGWHLA
jgi:hypothetical protein